MLMFGHNRTLCPCTLMIESMRTGISAEKNSSVSVRLHAKASTKFSLVKKTLLQILLIICVPLNSVLYNSTECINKDLCYAEV